MSTRRDARLAANAGPARNSEAITASLTLYGVERLTEGECIRLSAGLVECDLEGSRADRFVLAYELVEAPAAKDAVSVVVDVETC